ncbi:hypothetical protein I6F26_15005 [Ensifer sp. IC3342]|nr:hypothetical protein [Ensifer sp. BRP08]MCA1447886.1 hypothetical protein [Ensifer sp. IC3342]
MECGRCNRPPTSGGLVVSTCGWGVVALRSLQHFELLHAFILESTSAQGNAQRAFLVRQEQPIMIAVPPQRRAALMLAASIVGIAVSWLAATPFGLLAPVASLFFCVHRRTSRLLLAALGIAFVGSMLAVLFFSGGVRDLALLWAAFFAVALCIGAVVAAGMPASFDVDATRAVMRSGPGEGTSTGADKWADVDDEVGAQQALRRAYDRLAQATRAASLAELSAWLAHEVNQPLAAIVASSHACHHWLSAEPPNVERAKVTIERIIRSAGSAADIIVRIRALFRPAPQERSSGDVNGLIGEVCRLMADEIATKDVHIRTNLDPDLPSIALDRIQVQQVLMNLVRNGIEAMDAVVDSSRALQIRSCRDSPDAIRVEVRDAGTGFKDGERAFEPFFTTKQHGMGMGLSICRSIIESHGGRIWMADNETRGATVTFTLPLAASEAP